MRYGDCSVAAARWLGVSDTDVPLVLPNVAHFGTSRYLAFL
jgi:hypothetical protein